MDATCIEVSALLQTIKQHKTEHSHVEIKYHEIGTSTKCRVLQTEEELAFLIKTFPYRLQEHEGHQLRGVPMQVSIGCDGNNIIMFVHVMI